MVATTRVVVSESRPLDRLYDPMYTRSKKGRVYSSQRPLVPKLDAVAPSILLSPPQKERAVLNIKKAKDAWAQTDYRESESQTLPYAPEGIVEGDEVPEIVALAKLGAVGTKGSLLTASELKTVQDARAKHKLLLSLPPGTDEASLALRRKLLEAQEMKEYITKHRELDQANAIQLEAIRGALEERDQENQYLNDRRLQLLKNKKVEVAQHQIEHIQKTRIQLLRKLAQSRQRVPVMQSQGKRRRDFISEYSNFSSQVYAPMTREGGHKQIQQVLLPSLTSTQAIVTSCGNLKPLPITNMLDSIADTRPTKSRNKRRSLSVDLERAYKATLQTAELQRKALITKQPPQDQDKALVSLIETKSERAPTPRLASDPQSNDALDAALILVQRLLRGRAVQDEMLNAKSRRAELIAELRKSETHSVYQKTLSQDIPLATIDAIAGHAASALLVRLSQSDHEDEAVLLTEENTSSKPQAPPPDDENQEVCAQLARIESARNCVRSALDLAIEDSIQVADPTFFVDEFIQSILFSPLHLYAASFSRALILNTIASLSS